MNVIENGVVVGRTQGVKDIYFVQDTTTEQVFSMENMLDIELSLGQCGVFGFSEGAMARYEAVAVEELA